MGRVVLLLGISFLLATSASARTWHIFPDGTGDAATIQAGIDSAAAGDSVLLAPGHYTWSSQGASGHSMIQLTAGIVVRGELGPEQTILDAEGQRRVFVCRDSGDRVHLEGLTVQNGLAWWTDGQPFSIYYGGGILSTGASKPSIVNCIFRNNTTGIDNSGGAIYLENGGIVRDCTFIDNGCTGAGGALAARDATIDHCTFIRNSAGGHGCGDGGALFVSNCTVTDCMFEANRSGGAHCAGGTTALSVQGAGGTEVVRCTFRRHDGGTCVDAGGDCRLENCVFADNDVTSSVIRASTGGVEMIRCTILGNRISDGTEPLVDGPAVVEACLFAFNTGRACSDGIQPHCSDFYGNTAGDATCVVPGSQNFVEDPQFCAIDPAGSGNLTLQSDSPCAPGNHPQGSNCGQIGAGAVGCGSVDVDTRTWTAMKSLYR